MQREEEYEMVKERQNQMKQLEGDIVDLNSMFKDLAIMVHDQGEIIGIFRAFFLILRSLLAICFTQLKITSKIILPIQS